MTGTGVNESGDRNFGVRDERGREGYMKGIWV